MLADLRYALRTLARNPGFAFVSIFALALGIGANSAIFTVVNSVLLERLRFYQPQQLVVVRERNLEAGFPEFSLSPGNYLTYNNENHSFSGIAAVGGGSVNYAGAQEPERLRASRVTSNFFEVLHSQPALGRAFTKEETQLGADHVVILSYGLWRRLLESQLFEVRATDPATYAAVAFALTLTGFAACFVPALRALRVDPIVALRTE